MTFAEPFALLILLLVPAMAVLGVLVRRRRARHGVSFTNLAVLAQVAGSSRTRTLRSWVPLALLLLGLTIVGAAAARPQLKTTVADRHSVVVMLVDVSGSMEATDVKPDRITAAVNAMQAFVPRLPAEAEVGLIEFSTEPQIVTLPTTDHARVLGLLSYLAPSGATALGDGLATAIAVVKQTAVHGQGRSPGSPGAIVLLSDGAQNRGNVQPVEAAREAKAADIPVYTIAFGTPAGKLDVPGYGSVPVPPDPKTMAAIAHITGGKTFSAQTSDQVASAYKSLGAVIGRHTEKHDVTAWFALAAAFVLIGAILAALVFGPALQ